MIKKLFERFAFKAIDRLFRVPSIERFLLRCGLGVLIVIYGGFPLTVILIRLFLDGVPEGILNAQQAIEKVDIWIIGTCLLIIIVALGISIARFIGDRNYLKQKKIILIEARGLRDDDGSPLEKTVSNKFEGQIIPILLDLRNKMDGKVIAPEHAIKEITAVHRSLIQHKSDTDRRNLTTVYGGLTSVPYTYLTGVLLDDEGEIVTYDWDRTQEAWRSLDSIDNGKEFQVDGIDDISDTTEVVIALSFSYPINKQDIRSTFNHPIVRLTLDGMSSDAHWSQVKQNRLAQQFLEVVKHLSAVGVERIHLVMAAPNSTVFTFGRRYDKRNLPEIIVYQFEKGNNPAYPWGVLMPVSGVDQAKIVSG
ncbi:MAG: SAVED domain-containing protein [Paracoccaceae bacterium]|nr:SAVED domain-containing protein [Paracoccaceae bacterium]MDE2674600.1 SAVED domain-containing protein [Paracoccaceae bacterium]